MAREVSSPRHLLALLRLAIVLTIAYPAIAAATDMTGVRDEPVPPALAPSPLALRPERLGMTAPETARLAEPTTLERFLDWPSPRVQRGMAIGATVGAVAGVVTGLLATRGDDGFADLFEPILWIGCGAVGAVAGGIVGGVVAAVTGE